MHFGRHRVHDANDGLPGLHAFVVVDELAFHDAGERRTELGLLEQAEGVLIGGLDLCVTGLGAFELLAGYGFVLQQPLHTLHLRTGLLESRPVGRNLQFDIPGIEFGQQRPFLDAFALRDGLELCLRLNFAIDFPPLYFFS